MNNRNKINQRRRVLSIAAYSAAALMMPTSIMSQPLWAAAAHPQLHKWQGRALGAETSIQLYHHDKGRADNIINQCISLIRKYESIFSLYDQNSQLSMLNDQGYLKNPDAEFIRLTKIAQKFSAQTDGAFDITIQPLWNLYKSHFENDHGNDLNGEISKIISSVGWKKLDVNNGRIMFKRPHMGISFNGIAQGYVTDKVTELLNRHGFEHTLIDMGEYRAGGPQANGDPWRIGLLDPFDAVSIAHVIEMKTGAVATSGGYGDRFDATGKYHHIFNPKSGLSSNLYASVTVSAKDATTADALSTAFSNMSVGAIENTLSIHPETKARLTFHDGNIVRL